jgi:cell division protein FtsB
MNQNKNNQKPYSHLPGLVSIFVLALVFGGYFFDQRAIQRRIESEQKKLKQNESSKETYIANASEFNKNAKIQNTIDSLVERNDYLVGDAFDSYFEKLDKNYTLGKFLSADQIKKINTVISSHLHKASESNNIVYKYVKSYMPINQSTPLRIFEDIVDCMNITPIELMPYGVEFDNGAIFQFYKPAAQDLFYKYLDEYEAAYSGDTEPNFGIKEIAPVHDEYVKNCEKISKLEHQIAYNDSIFNQNLAKFDATRDSLNRVIKNLKSRLK